MATKTQTLIQDFLARRRFALVGISHDPQDFSRRLFQDFLQRGYDVVPVNPNIIEVAGQPCFARVQDITPPIDAVLVMTTPAITEQIAQDCAEAHVKLLWMHRGVGAGSVNPTAAAFCATHQIDVISGFCPYMFLPNSGFIHRAHGYILKLTGSYAS